MLGELNYLAIIIAAVAWIALSFIWFEGIFKAQWRAAAGVAPDWKPGNAPIGAAVLALLSAVVLDVILTIIEPGSVTGPGWLAGAVIAFIMWVGFVFTGHTQEALFMATDRRRYWIETSYTLVGMLIMGAIIGFWH